jgi:glycosyltransferase involved in cell wall biosynthesis
VSVAKGDWIMFLDGDDTLRRDAVDRLLAVCDGCELVQFLYTEVWENTEPRIPADGNPYYLSTPHELFSELYRLGGVAASGCTKFMTRALAKALPFENFRHEDEMWCTRAFSKPLSVTYLPSVLYFYLMRENSLIHSSFNPRKLDIFTIALERIKTLESLGLSELVHHEYVRIFSYAVSLWCEARAAHDADSAKKIKNIFKAHKKDIRRHSSHLTGRQKLLFYSSCALFETLELYRIAKNLKNVGERNNARASHPYKSKNRLV